ncbi:putative transcription factor TUBBY family [Rosa chinensis]|uniref:Putative transcription factor TUBBY family n=1 Tax=Rosa chinensis TaxID=74649 RepID=A0A2P6RVA0_ROSCH|nr:tubby-like protein 8 [Rosa chinensis]PRQ50351.1 putative transcription factor TUBBY family [Rosa chinensis]
MMSGCKRTALMPRQSSYNSLYVNRLNDPKHNRSSSEGDDHSKPNQLALASNDEDKENATPNNNSSDKENLLAKKPLKQNQLNKSFSTGCGGGGGALKPSSLQFCMQMSEPEKELFGGSKMWDQPSVTSDNSSSLKIWDYSDSEAAPASSWSTLPNKSLLCRPLPMDVGRCTCVIVKEKSPAGGSLYSLYTNEGKGRQDRKLAVAHHKRRNGKSELTIAQNMKGILSHSDDSFIGMVTANLMGSKYHIWDQGKQPNCLSKQSKSLLAAVLFTPTISTWTGSYRRIRAYVPKHQSMQLKNTAQVQHIKGLPTDWEGKMDKIHQLYSRVPLYNKISKQYELDFRDRGRAGLRIQSSVKNFQLTLEENGKQTILQLGRVGKSKYVMDYRYPLTGYQAFCICLASIDSKLCCSV